MMKRWRAAVDRFEEGYAVLIPEDRPSARILIPRSLLPTGISDGALLVFKVEKDKARAEARRHEIASLQAELEASPRPGRDGNAGGMD